MEVQSKAKDGSAQSAGGGDRPVSAVGLPDGVAPLAHLRSVVESLRPGWGDRQPLLLTHRSPDPDALGALAGLDFLLRHAFGLEPETATSGRIFRAENQAMVRELGLHFLDYKTLDCSKYAGIFLVDTQPGFGHTPLPEGAPVIGVFDHHRPPDKLPGDGPMPPHYDVRLGVGATSAMIYEYLADAGIELDPAIATALCCGVRFDTADHSLDVTELDTRAYYESFRRADRRMLARISRPVLPPSYYQELHRSLSRARRHGPLVFGWLGQVKNPESVAEMADFFLRMEGCRWSLVGGAFDGNYHLSVRTDLRFSEAYPLMEKVLDGEGSFGGRGTVAGGQIPLSSLKSNKNGDGDSLQALERRLRARALKLVAPEDLKGSDPKHGTRLTRLP